MNDLVFFYPDGHQRHAEAGHPERPERVEAIREALDEAGLWASFPHLGPRPLSHEVLHAIHDPAYLDDLKRASQQGQRLDMDTYITPDSWQLALNAAGGVIAVAEVVWRQEAKRGFALTRPPGHHATPNRAMGFCLLNNIALAAEHLLQVEGAQRLAIIDIDLHHGNGTQDIFWRRGEVFYFSTHQSPLYPGTGQINETGAGPGEGGTANLPLPPFSGNRAMQACLDEVIFPLLGRFQPQMLLVSVGFDAHWRDPLGNLLLTSDQYGSTLSALTHWADEHCEGRIALCLEGGYDLEAGANSALAATQALLGQPWEDSIGESPHAEENFWEPVIARARQIWQL